jgi:glycosyltransferase involved in cell wall biosynthesis
MRPKILFVSIFSDVNSVDNSRMNNVYNSFEIFEREVVTADFDHARKMYKDKNSLVKREYIHVPKYKKNISLMRLYSHIVFGIKLKKHLNKMTLFPDILYCTMPSSYAAYVSGKFCKKNKIKFVIDIIDIWPDSLWPISPIFNLLKPFACIWGAITRQAYEMADYVSAESKKYMEVAASVNKSNNFSYTYLGIDVKSFNQLLEQSSLNISRKDDEIQICYGGSLGNSYDFDSILKAIQYIHLKGIKYKFWFIGGGEKQEKLESYAKLHNLNMVVTGFIVYPDYLKYLSICDIAINSFKRSTKVAYSFKFNDYVGCHLFVLNSLKGETSDMIDRFSIGLNYESDSLHEVLLNVCQNWESYKLWKDNNKLLIESCLDARTIYDNLKVDILLKLGFKKYLDL